MLKHISELISFAVSFTDFGCWFLFRCSLFPGGCWCSTNQIPQWKSIKSNTKLKHTHTQKVWSVFVLRENSLCILWWTFQTKWFFNHSTGASFQSHCYSFFFSFSLSLVFAKTFSRYRALSYVPSQWIEIVHDSFCVLKIQFSLFNWHDCYVTNFIESISIVFLFLSFKNLSYKSKFDCCACVLTAFLVRKPNFSFCLFHCFFSFVSYLNSLFVCMVVRYSFFCFVLLGHRRQKKKYWQQSNNWLFSFRYLCDLCLNFMLKQLQKENFFFHSFHSFQLLLTKEK